MGELKKSGKILDTIMGKSGQLCVSGDTPAEDILLVQNKLTELIVRKVCTVVVDDLWLWIRYMSALVAKSRKYSIESGTDVQGPKWVFRGQADADWPICSSFELRVANKYAGTTAYRDRELRAKEKYSIDQFKREAWRFVGNSDLDVLEWLSLMRHYGVPTRLVDFSDSPIVALFFAVSEDCSADFAVWSIAQDSLSDAYRDRKLDQALDKARKVCGDATITPELMSKLGSEDLKCLGNSLTDMYRNLASVPSNVYQGYAANRDLANRIIGTDLDEDIEACHKYFMLALRPARLNARLSAQAGLFLMPTSVSKSFTVCLQEAMGSNAFRTSTGEINIKDAFDTNTLDLLVEDKVVKYRFPKEVRQFARDYLAMANVSYRTLFPDIDGISKAISFN